MRPRLLRARVEEKTLRDLEPVRVDLHEHVIHHAHRVVPRPVRREPRAVRHRAGRNLRDLDHRADVHDGHRTRLVLAVQVEVRREQQPCRRHLHGGGEEPQFSAPQRAVRLRGIGDDRAEGVPVGERHVPPFPARIDRQAVRPVDFRGETAHEDGIQHRRTGAIEPDEIDAILRFGRHVDVVRRRAVGADFLGRPRAWPPRPSFPAPTRPSPSGVWQAQSAYDLRAFATPSPRSLRARKPLPPDTSPPTLRVDNSSRGCQSIRLSAAEGEEVADGCASRRSRKVRAPQGTAPGNARASRGDGKCHREQTADGNPATLRGPGAQARVKGWGKGPPRFLVTGTARQTPPGARPSRNERRPVAFEFRVGRTRPRETEVPDR